MRSSVRDAATALTLLASGAFALPSTKVAFVQHGVADGDDAIMHGPSKVTTRIASLTPQLLSSAIARVMSLDARAEVDTGLPAGDIFNRPDGNVLVFVDGLRPTGTKSTPYMTEWLKQPTAAYTLRTPTDNTWTSGLESALGDAFDVVEAVGRNGGVVCASLDSTLLYSEACAGAHLAMPTADPADPLWAKASRMGPGVVVDSSSGLKTLTLSKGDEGEEAVLDMSVEADLRLAEELSFLSLLPAALADRFSKQGEASSPPLVIVYLSSLRSITSTYGQRSAKTALASNALDGALAEAFEAMSTGAGRRLTSQLVAGRSLGETLAVGGRRLAEDSSNDTDNVTLVDITQFQLNMWTGVGLALVGFLAIYATFTMDIQPDSLLYAKFITDTSGSGLKTD